MTTVLSKTIDACLSLFVIASLTFVLLRWLPGGPFDDEVALPPEIKTRIEESYYLNKPVLEQYSYFLKQALHGDLGFSYRINQVKVSQIILEAAGPSMILGILALMTSLIFGVGLGMLGGIYQNKAPDRILQFFVTILMSFPSFLSGPFLVLVFSFWLDWLPPALWDGPKYYILPVITLSLRSIALVSRLVRSSFLETSSELYVKTAYAKGLPFWKIYGFHILRNSLLPLMGLLAPLTANLLSGSFVTEAVFAIPGLGRHLVDSVLNRDFPLVLGLTLFYSSILIVAHWISDILGVLLDPRLRLGLK